MLQNAAPSIFWVTFVSTAVAAYMYAFDQHVLPEVSCTAHSRGALPPQARNLNACTPYAPPCTFHTKSSLPCPVLTVALVRARAGLPLAHAQHLVRGLHLQHERGAVAAAGVPHQQQLRALGRGAQDVGRPAEPQPRHHAPGRHVLP